MGQQRRSEALGELEDGELSEGDDEGEIVSGPGARRGHRTAVGGGYGRPGPPPPFFRFGGPPPPRGGLPPPALMPGQWQTRSWTPGQRRADGPPLPPPPRGFPGGPPRHGPPPPRGFDRRGPPGAFREHHQPIHQHHRGPPVRGGHRSDDSDEEGAISTSPHSLRGGSPRSSGRKSRGGSPRSSSRGAAGMRGGDAGGTAEREANELAEAVRSLTRELGVQEVLKSLDASSKALRSATRKLYAFYKLMKKTRKISGADDCPELAALGGHVFDGLRSLHVVLSTGVAKTADLGPAREAIKGALRDRYVFFTSAQRKQLDGWCKGTHVFAAVLASYMAEKAVSRGEEVPPEVAEVLARTAGGGRPAGAGTAGEGGVDGGSGGAGAGGVADGRAAVAGDEGRAGKPSAKRPRLDAGAARASNPFAGAPVSPMTPPDSPAHPAGANGNAPPPLSPMTPPESPAANGGAAAGVGGPSVAPPLSPMSPGAPGGVPMSPMSPPHDATATSSGDMHLASPYAPCGADQATSGAAAAPPPAYGGGVGNDIDYAVPPQVGAPQRHAYAASSGGYDTHPTATALDVEQHPQYHAPPPPPPPFADNGRASPQPGGGRPGSAAGARSAKVMRPQYRTPQFPYADSYPNGDGYAPQPDDPPHFANGWPPGPDAAASLPPVSSDAATAPPPSLDGGASAAGAALYQDPLHGRLALVLDIDHTLLNSAHYAEVDGDASARLSARLEVEASLGEARRELFKLDGIQMWSKLRPGVREFLAAAAQRFQLWIHTNGNEQYARAVLALLDPRGGLFGERVIAQGAPDGAAPPGAAPQSKALVAGLAGRDASVVVVDDSVAVWPGHGDNLLAVERYVFFPSSRAALGLRGKSLLELNRDECPERGMLTVALDVLLRLHARCAAAAAAAPPGLDGWDVRDALRAERVKVLGGVRIAFSRVIPLEQRPEGHPLWQLAQQFGASCTQQADEAVTHVVAAAGGTEKVLWAQRNGKHVVLPAWLECSCMLWKRADERRFAVY